MLRILRFQQVMTKTMTSIARNPAYALIHTSHSRILMADKVNLSDAEWQAKLSPVQFKVLRQKATEPPRSGPYNKHYEKGVYLCAGCETPLFTSAQKFDSGCGWPAFFDCIPGAVARKVDADGHRVEIICAKCDGHLGHVFKGEGWRHTPEDERHCVNSVSLKFNAEQ